jgi:hypothetical protein
MCTSGIYTINNAPTSVAIGGTVPLGSAIHRFGSALNLNGNAINVTESGYYEFITSAIANPTAAGTVTITMYRDGVAVPGAIGSASVTTAGNPITISFPFVARVNCCGDTSTITYVLSGSASTVNNIAVVAKKIGC